ncbi:MAG: hypothetical protein K2Q24_03535 [Chitinophagaceae bacterium]|nr:hypothetical protein [Chitinophagaceae bacterium]
MKIVIFFGAILFMLLAACTNFSQRNNVIDNAGGNESKMFGNDRRYKALGISSVSSTVDSPQFRIWLEEDGFKDTGSIIIFRKNKGLWQGEFHTYTFAHTSEESVIEVSHHYKKDICPTLNSSRLTLSIDSFFNYKFNDSNNYKYDCFEGETVFLQFCNNGNYKEYLFPCRANADREASVVFLKSFLYMLKAECKIPVIGVSSLQPLP